MKDNEVFYLICGLATGISIGMFIMLIKADIYAGKLKDREQGKQQYEVKIDTVKSFVPKPTE